ncbi:hypothetical protein L5515_006254 [Caenorhabditis briggsae]|uniref:SXP/RAL-2 family protein Ani s 5-like cation-binding domain-containing protein n=1 Tax=Caenorhabditis briggsae TaxID=6238 RepID=A0AAE9EVH4_CAEBR|nr:hypothetical protein L5515_006254 [Caenorhabditis briggsae]
MYSFKAVFAVVASIALVSGAHGGLLGLGGDEGGLGGLVGGLLGENGLGGILKGLLGDNENALSGLLGILGGNPGGLGLPILGDITTLPQFLLDFLQKVPSDILPQVIELLSNTSLNINEITDKLTDLLSGKIDDNLLSDLLATVADLVHELLDGIANVLTSLGKVFEDLTDILQNKDQSIAQQKDAIDKLRQKSPIEVEINFFIASQVVNSLQNGQIPKVSIPVDGAPAV